MTSLDLIKAVRFKHYDKIQSLLDVHVHPEVVDQWGNSPFSFAIRNDDPEAYKMLLAKTDKDVIDTRFHVHLAVKNEAINILTLLATYGTDMTLKDPHGRKPIWYATRTNNKRVIKLISNNINATDFDLFKAIRDEDMTIIEYLISERNINVNELDAYDKSTLYYALDSNNAEIVEYLLTHGYNLTENKFFNNYLTNNKNMNFDILLSLCRNEATANILFNIVETNKLDILKKLVALNVDIFILRDGIDLYDWARNFNNISTMYYLAMFGISGAYTRNMQRYYIPVNRQICTNQYTIITMEETADTKIDIIVYEDKQGNYDPFGFEPIEIEHFFNIDNPRLPTDKPGNHLICSRTQIEPLYHLLTMMESELKKDYVVQKGQLMEIIRKLPEIDDYYREIHALFNPLTEDDKIKIHHFINLTFQLGMKMRRWIEGEFFPMQLTRLDDTSAVIFSNWMTITTENAYNRGLIKSAFEVENYVMEHIIEMIKYRETISEQGNIFLNNIRVYDVVNGEHTVLRYNGRKLVDILLEAQERNACIQLINHYIIATAIKHLDVLYGEMMNNFPMDLFRYMHY